jgi:hypothetical protein
MNQKLLEKLFEYIDLKIKGELVKDSYDNGLLESVQANQIKDELINMIELPDESRNFMISIPLPKDHWIYTQCEEWDNERNTPADTPRPILTRELAEKVRDAAKYAVRGATMNGISSNFDPDVLVLNFIYALCGPTV